MRALVYHGPKDIRVDTVPDPVPDDPSGVIVRIERTGICGSDLHIYHGVMGPAAGYGVGHEAIGEVVETGSHVTRFRSGDRVLIAGVVGCASCTPCRHDHVTACENGLGSVFGTNQGLPGGQAEALAVPNADAHLHAIPEGLTDEQAVLLTDILPTGYYGAENAEIEPGHEVAVIGAGPVGQMAIQCALLFGPRRVFALDRVPERLAAAEKLGAIPVDASSDLALASVIDATGGLGPHSVIEAVGADVTIQNAVQLVRRGGRVSIIGVNVNLALPFPMAIALMKGITLRVGVVPVPKYWPQLVPLLAEGRLRPDSVFTHQLGLGQGAEAYALFDDRRDGVLKVMLDPSA